MSFQIEQPMTAAQLDDLVRGYSDQELSQQYQSARTQPGTAWARLLSMEIGRRDAMAEVGR